MLAGVAGSAADKQGPQGRGWGVRGPCWLAGLPCGLLGRVSGMGHGKESVRAGFGLRKVGRGRGLDWAEVGLGPG